MYEDSTAVLGPLSRLSEPHAYDLCQEHASRMTAPRGWELLRVAGGIEASDDLVALADAVTRRPAPEHAGAPPAASARSPRSAGDSRTSDDPRAAGDSRSSRQGEQTSARHLHVVRNPHD